MEWQRQLPPISSLVRRFSTEDLFQFIAIEWSNQETDYINDLALKVAMIGSRVGLLVRATAITSDTQNSEHEVP